MMMKIGLQLPNFTWPGGPARIAPKLADIARAADEAGFYSLWVMDHFFQISMIGPPEQDMLEAYTTLGYLAGLTRRVKLGTMVTGVVYRHPGMLVKSVTTLDVLSGGRAYFAIGAAWNEQEARGLGLPFPPLGVRFEMLEETLCVPQPLSLPHPPILVAGGGEKRTLRLVAQYADACNLYGDVETIRAKLDILKRHCEALGRDFRTIEITTLGTVDPQPGKMSSNQLIAQCKALAAIGVQHAVFNMPTVHELAPIEIFRREIIPAVAGF
jgi:alkanesulfonate monooxygenase SsuD/methylene tetrahydromethanopterin reductase-like flavin-dependent oxidoreductase (luciferase family)